MTTTSSREGSPLSSLDSEEDPFQQHEQEEDHTVQMPPAKRQKTGGSSRRATPTLQIVDDDALSTISSDTDGELPASPTNVRPDEDDVHEQVTVCAWEGCHAGDLENMDLLVNHINIEHVEFRQKEHTCEWLDCRRKGMPHSNSYALRAHIRSHTREKPYHCVVPECDRAFTRSDALAKHMRTVHETEALRPSDPVPKSMQGLSHRSELNKPIPKLKLIVKGSQTQQSAAQTPTPVNGTSNGHDTSGWVSSFPPELGFTPEEEAKGPKELYRLLRRQVFWAEEEALSLKQSVDLLDKLRREEWIEKEILLDQTINTDTLWHKRRKEVLASVARATSEAAQAAVERESTQGGNVVDSPAPLKEAESIVG